MLERVPSSTTLPEQSSTTLSWNQQSSTVVRLSSSVRIVPAQPPAWLKLPVISDVRIVATARSRTDTVPPTPAELL